MGPGDALRLLIFLGCVILVFLLTIFFIQDAVMRRISRVTAPHSRFYIRLSRAVYFLAAVGVLCIVYGYKVEPYWPQVTRLTIASPKLQKNSRPIRIVLISDVHSDPVPRLEPKLPGIIAAERPDLIFYTGDSANSFDAISVFREMIGRLGRIAPTYAVRGNWDMSPWALTQDLFDSPGVRELDGEAVRVEVQGTPIWISGARAWDEPKLAHLFEKIPENEFSVFLYHFPHIITKVTDEHVDLVCAGHIHGGQVALPFYGAILTLSPSGKQFESGLYRVKGTRLYVSRGIGMEGGFSPRVRFFARPEITVIDLVPASWFSKN